MEFHEEDVVATPMALGGAKVTHPCGLEIEVCVHPVYTLNLDAALRAIRQAVEGLPERSDDGYDQQVQ